jgi:DNA-binding NarL/FixJ family response regulator
MSSAPLRLMLVDEDPVFRLGLKIWLEQSAGFAVVAEASQGDEALAALAARRPPAETWSETDEAELEGAFITVPDLDLVILDLGLGEGMPDQIPGLQLCAEIKSRYPALPVLVLSSRTEPVLQAAAKQMGADAYGARGMPVRELAQLIQQLVSPPETLAIQGTVTPAETFGQPVPGPLTALRISLRLSSLQQIEAAMTELRTAQRLGTGSPLSDALVAGRYRELKAARWLIKRILATPGFSDQWTSAAPAAPPPPGAEAPPPQRIEPMAETRLPEPGQTLVPTPSERLSLQRGDLQTLIFESVFRKLQGSLENASSLPLETDILREEKKRELLFLTLRKLEDALDDLRQARLLPGQLTATSPDILRDVWQAVIIDFFGRYYTLEVDTLEQPVVKTLLQEEPTVQSAILNKIPQVPLLLGHLLFQEAMLVDGSAFLATTPEALGRSRLLLENLLIQVANAVMQPLLNRFADAEELKKHLYQRRIMSTRDIERFRNDLSWRYRWDSLVNEPKAIFESQHRLLTLTERGIQTRFVYAPRQEELERLSGLQLSVTLAIEARDAIAPRLRTTISFLGSGLVYLLTDVVGRGIGLIGRGIIKGVGSAWSDPRYWRKRQ